MLLPRASRNEALEAELLATGRKIRSLVDLELSLGESFTVDLVARNPLAVEVVLSDLRLTTEPPIDISLIDEINLRPQEARTISFRIVPSEIASYTITSISFLFHNFFPCTQSLAKRGKRLHATKVQRLKPAYAADRSLTIEVGPSRPRLAAHINCPSEMFLGEVVERTLLVENVGITPIYSLDLFTSESGISIATQSTAVDSRNRIMPNTPSSLHSQRIEPGVKVSIPVTFTALTAGPISVHGLVIFGEDSAPISADVLVLPLLETCAWVEARRSGLVGIDVSSPIYNVLFI